MLGDGIPRPEAAVETATRPLGSSLVRWGGYFWVSVAGQLSTIANGGDWPASRAAFTTNR